MRRLLYCLVPWMATTAAWTQGSRPVDVVYSYLGPLATQAKRVASECYVSPAQTQQLGWRVRLVEGEADIEAEGRRIRVVTRTIDGGTYLPFIAALEQLGARAQWDSSGSRLSVAGVVRDVRLAAGSLMIMSTIGVSAKVFKLDQPQRLVIDLAGATLPASPDFGLPPGIRIGLYGEGVRVVVEDPAVAGMKLPPLPPGRRFDVPLSGVSWAAPPVEPQIGDVTALDIEPQPPAEEQTQPAPTPDSTSTEAQPPEQSLERALAARAGAISVSQRAPDRLGLRFPFSGPAPRPIARYLDPLTVELSFPGVVVTPRSLELGNDPLVRSVSWVLRQGEAPRVICILKRPLGMELSVLADSVQLTLVRPEGANGKLAGKTIVVDAGHGGVDKGAKSSDGKVFEKDLTMSMVKQVSTALSKAGAGVILSRDTDFKVPLKDRSSVANQNRADLFVSIHFNSNRVANSRSGSMTFYHAQDRFGMLLAECIQSELAKVTKLPDLGIWSDTRIYASGFAVLRYARMPAVLVELAFINHSQDLKQVLSQDFQDATAKAIVKGIKVYFGDAGQVKGKP